MGKRAERRARRKEKVVAYAQRIFDDVKAHLNHVEPGEDLSNAGKMKLIEQTEGKEAWWGAFEHVVAGCTSALVKRTPQEKELILDGMRHYLDVLFEEADGDESAA